MQVRLVYPTLVPIREERRTPQPVTLEPCLELVEGAHVSDGARGRIGQREQRRLDLAPLLPLSTGLADVAALALVTRELPAAVAHELRLHLLYEHLECHGVHHSRLDVFLIRS